MIWANIHQDSCFCERGCETAARLLRKAQEIADLLEANSSSSSSSSPLLAPSCQHPKCVGEVCGSVEKEEEDMEEKKEDLRAEMAWWWIAQQHQKKWE